MQKLKLAIVTDAFPPLNTSASVQIRDIALGFVSMGHDVTVMVAATDQKNCWMTENYFGVTVLRLYSPKIRDVSHFQRFCSEMLMPYSMLFSLGRSPFNDMKWDGVICYSPSIFFTPLVKTLKRRGNCKGYLVLRDMFPEWAVDLGLIRSRFLYSLLKYFAQKQFYAAEIIGVQSKGNLHYFDSLYQLGVNTRVEVLNNWLGPKEILPLDISFEDTVLSGRKILIYAGNMGVAQDIGRFIDLANRMTKNREFGFLFIGRGSEVQTLKDKALNMGLDNILFMDEILPEQLNHILENCFAGLVSLSSHHRSHNIPGKLLNYFRSGIPVLACVNEGNDLIEIIREHNVGEVCETGCLDDLFESLNRLILLVEHNNEIKSRCETVFDVYFSVSQACNQIVNSIADK